MPFILAFKIVIPRNDKNGIEDTDYGQKEVIKKPFDSAQVGKLHGIFRVFSASVAKKND